MSLDHLKQLLLRIPLETMMTKVGTIYLWKSFLSYYMKQTLDFYNISKLPYSYVLQLPLSLNHKQTEGLGAKFCRDKRQYGPSDALII